MVSCFSLYFVGDIKRLFISFCLSLCFDFTDDKLILFDSVIFCKDGDMFK